MERTCHWVLSQDMPTDIVVDVGEVSFALHRVMLAAKSSLLRKMMMESEEREPSRIDLSAIPGGPESFGRAAKFCYGVNFEITVQNAAALLCAAEFLQMTDDCCDGNLARRTEGFLCQVGLTSLPAAVAVLKSCQGILSFAEDLRIVQRCVDVISVRACNEAHFPSRSPPHWWAEELSVLDVPSLKKIIRAMATKGAKASAIAVALTTYAERWLFRDIVGALTVKTAPCSGGDRCRRRELLEAIVALLPSSDKSVPPVRFLCCLLRAATFMEAGAGCRSELERRIAAALELATVDDLLMLSFSYAGEKKVLNLEAVNRIVSRFVEENHGRCAASVVFGGGLSTAAEGCSSVMHQVGKILDSYLAHIAAYPELTISMFNDVAITVPKAARTVHDDLYRAVDIYLKAHPCLDEIEREKACCSVDPLRLSCEARGHASQNKRLPVQVVLHALYYDQLKARSTDADDANLRRRSMNVWPPRQPSTAADDRESALSTAAAGKNQLQLDLSLVRENEALRSELKLMKTYVADLQKKGAEASGSSTPAAPALALSRWPVKKPGFFSSVGRTLGKLNPFGHGSRDTSHIKDSAGDHVIKPRRRRFSIS